MSISKNSEFSKSFTSNAQAITFGGLLTLAHGLGVVPKIIQVLIKNVTTQGNWVAGDEIYTGFFWDNNGTEVGNAIYVDATNIYVRIAADMVVPNKTTGVRTPITAANWNYIFKAWA